MERQHQFALTPVAGAIAAALAPTSQALAQSDNALEEIIVTATKRTTSVQDIPASIQAITQDSIEAMGAKGMEDYSRFVPSVNVISYGAGSSTVVFRGAITGSSYIAASTSSVYLDEIALTTTGSQPNIRMVDVERVEALAGPQGTLYGSDAQAGTMRIITNKPKLNEFEAVLDTEVRAGDKSDMSHRASLVFNIPLVEDKFAARIVGYSDHDGGFINNVFGHTPNVSMNNALPAGWGTLDNASVVDNRWNDADVYGGRLSLLWDVNDKWSMNFTAMHQTTEAGADNYFDPYVGDLQGIRFHDEWREDKYEMYSFQVSGDLGFAQLVASANYYDREVEQLYDITIYGKYWSSIYCHDSYYTTASVDYYTGYLLYPYYWENPDTGYVIFFPVYCMGQTLDEDYFQSYPSPLQQSKQNVEIRLSSQGDTFDWIVGYYWEESDDAWQAPFAQPTTGGRGETNLYQGSISQQFMEWYFSNYYGTPTTFPTATSWWYSDSHTDWDQQALFGEATWHINDNWDLTLGGRFFDRSNTNFYRVDHPGGLNLMGEPDTADPATRQYRLANNNIAPANRGTEEEFIPKVALSYTLDSGDMMYGLFTRGTRPGGVNRSRGEPFFSTTYDSDIMDNYEVGYRSTFGDGRGRLNVTGFHMEWSDYQLQLTDPSSSACDPGGPSEIPNVCGQPWQSIVTNAGAAHITGVNFELDYAIGDSTVIGFNGQLLEAETDTTADLTGDGDNDLVAGLRLPLTPELKLGAWIDSSKPSDLFGGEDVFWRFQVSHTGDSVNKLDPAGLDDANPQFTTDSYTIADFRTGVRGEDWELALFVNNLADERAIYTIGTGQMNWGFGNTVDNHEHWQKAYTNRPREFGVRFTKSWGD
ncbi:MAG: TonB-dependent receptor [Pseudomonadota bacterium]